MNNFQYSQPIRIEMNPVLGSLQSIAQEAGAEGTRYEPGCYEISSAGDPCETFGKKSIGLPG
jgi:hypothetical protein